MLGLNPVTADSMNDEWEKKIAVDDCHFVENNEWVKQQAVKGAAKDTAHVKQILERLK